MTESATPQAVPPEQQQLTLEKASIDWRSIQTQMAAGVIAIFITCVVIYWQRILGPFEGTIDPISAGSDQFSNELRGIGTNPELGWRPVFYLFLSVFSTVFHTEPFGYHVVNMLLLFGAGVMLAFTVLEITGKYGNRLGACPAIWAGLLYVAHPWNSEMIMQLNGMQPLLGSFFAMMSLFCFLRYRLVGEKNYFIVSLVSFVLSAFSWDSAVLLPVVFTLSLMIPDANAKPLRSKLENLAPFWTFTLLYAIARPDWVRHISEVVSQPRFVDIGSAGSLIMDFMRLVPENPVDFPAEYVVFGAIAILIVRMFMAQESFRPALFVFLWAILYFVQPRVSWEYAFLPPMCASIAFISLPAIDNMGKGTAALYATAGSQLLICLVCYWAFTSLR